MNPSQTSSIIRLYDTNISIVVQYGLLVQTTREQCRDKRLLLCVGHVWTDEKGIECSWNYSLKLFLFQNTYVNMYKVVSQIIQLWYFVFEFIWV